MCALVYLCLLVASFRCCDYWLSGTRKHTETHIYVGIYHTHLLFQRYKHTETYLHIGIHRTHLLFQRFVGPHHHIHQPLDVEVAVALRVRGDSSAIPTYPALSPATC